MKNQLYYTKPAKCFEQALPLGNGRLGIMTYGNLRRGAPVAKRGQPVVRLPQGSKQGRRPQVPGACREAIFAKDYAKAKDILNRDMHGHWSEAYLPLGNLRIDYDRAYKKNYRPHPGSAHRRGGDPSGRLDPDGVCLPPRSAGGGAYRERSAL